MMACEQDDKTSPSFLQADEPETPATKLETSSDKRVPYLPPCRVCDSVASGFHYGKTSISKQCNIVCRPTCRAKKVLKSRHNTDLLSSVSSVWDQRHTPNLWTFSFYNLVIIFVGLSLFPYAGWYLYAFLCTRVLEIIQQYQ